MILDSENQLLYFDLNSDEELKPKLVTDNSDLEIHDFSVSISGYIAVLYWNENDISIFNKHSLLFKSNVGQYSPFDASAICLD